MSIASTKLSMGYVNFTKSQQACYACAHAVGCPDGSLKCKEGGFYVARFGTCRKFQSEPTPRRPDGVAQPAIS